MLLFNIHNQIITMKIFTFRLVIIVALYFSICACGNKGDLYMPDKDKAASKQLP